MFIRTTPAHRPPKAEVTGSNPVGCANTNYLKLTNFAAGTILVPRCGVNSPRGSMVQVNEFRNCYIRSS